MRHVLVLNRMDCRHRRQTANLFELNWLCIKNCYFILTYTFWNFWRMEQTQGGRRVSAWCGRCGERRHEFVQDLARQFDVVLGEFQRPPRIDFVEALGDQPAEVVVHSGASRQRRVDARRGADGRVVPCWQRRHRTLRHAHRLTGRRVAGCSPAVHAHTNVEDVLAQAMCLYASFSSK